MVEQEPTAEFVQRLRDQNPQAAEKLVDLYGQRLIRLAEQHLNRKLAGRVEGEDVVQSVFRTFFRRSVGGEFRIDSSAEIWRLLVKITLLKTRMQARYHTAQMRDVDAETSEGALWLARAAQSEPGPTEAAMLAEQIHGLLRGLPQMYGDILQMRLAGHSATETAAKLGVSRRTVHRALSLLKQRLSATDSTCDK